MKRHATPDLTPKATRDVSPNDLRAFVAVVEHESFSKAALAIGISQPTVSLRLQNLENSLGLRLIDRRQGSRPTETGRGLYNQARRALTELDVLEAFAHELGELQRGVLRVGASTLPVAMSLIGAFREAHPGVDLQVSQGNTFSLLDGLKRSDIDVAIMTLLEPPGAPFTTEAVCRQRLSAIVPADHPLADTHVVTWTRLLREKLIVRARPSMTYTQIEAELAARGAALDDPFELPSREAVKEAVAAGFGVGLAFATEIGDDRRIAAVEITDADETASVHVVALQDVSGLPAVANFLDIAGRRSGR